MISQLFANHRTCTWRCRSQQHAQQLASAITKSSSSINNTQLKVYLALTCPNAPRSSDLISGRTLVHWAASCDDRAEILEWLLDEFGAEIDARDFESGYTPLHRALLYGQLRNAQALIDRDASLTILDREGLSPMDIVRRDQGIGLQGSSRDEDGKAAEPVRFSLKGPTEVYSCGENVTSNLGHRVPTERGVPDLVDYLSRRGLSVEKVAMSKWHTAFLTTGGTVYTCGHGSSGRLGHGDTNDRTVPTLVEITNERCVKVSVGDEHTVVVTANGSAWAWGGNKHRQLGVISTADPVLSPQPILLSKNVKDHSFLGCACSSSYTILWTNDFVYGCGANEGQFGRCASKSESDVYPLRQLVSVAAPFVGADLLDIACGDTAIAILTKKFDLILLHNYESRRILSRLLNFTHVIMNSGGSKKSERHRQQQHHQSQSSSLIRLTLFSEGGFVYYWDTKDQHLRTCRFIGAVRKTIYPRSACAFGDDGLFLVTDDGKLYKGRVREVTTATSTSDVGNAEDPEKSASASKTSTAPVKEERRAPKNASVESKSRTVTGDAKGGSKNAATTDFKWTSTRTSASGATSGYFVSRDGHSPLESLEQQLVVLSSPVQAVHRAIAVSSTSDGRNFCVIQQDPKVDLVELPSKSASTLSADYGALLEEAQVEDCLHDVQVRTSENGAQFRALHKFVLCSRCPYFSKRLQPSTTQLQIDEPTHVVTEFALNRILDFIYTDDCDLFHVGPLMPDSFRDYDHHVGTGSGIEKRSKSRDPVREVLEASKRLNIKALTKRLETLRWDPSMKTVAQVARYYPGPQRLRFEPNAFPELCDVRLQCKDGVKIPAHRCVLSSRAEYFRCMFASGWWSETSRHQILKVDVESDVLTPVLHYLYTDELPAYSKLEQNGTARSKRVGDKDLYARADKEMLEHYGKILVCADQWLLDRLRQLCEIELAARITLRNAVDMLDFASAINADQLFATCSQFMSLNLCALLEANALRCLSSDCLRQFGAYYRDFYRHVGHRAVTPSSEPPSVGDIEEVWNDVLASGVSPDDVLQEFLDTWTQMQAAGSSPTAAGTSGKKKRSTATMTPRARRTSATLSISTAPLSENAPETPKSAANKSESPAGAKTPLAVSKATNAIPAQEQKTPWTKAGKGKGAAMETQVVKTPAVASAPVAVPSAGRLPPRSRNKPWNVALSPTECFPEVSLRDLMEAEEKKQAATVTERRKSSAAVVVRQRPSLTDQTFPPAASTSTSPHAAWASLPQASQAAWNSTSPPSFAATVRPTVPVSPDQQAFPPPSSSSQKKLDQKPGGNRGFDEIVKEEKLKEAARTRILNKPLKVIQDEELAMQELALIYQVDDEWDEFITVERAVAFVSEPTWQAHVGSPPRF